MSSTFKPALTLFLALFALYSPLAALSSYFPIVSKLKPKDQAKLAFGLFTYVAIFGMVALWIGEPLLELLGISTAALTVTGGIALMYAAIPIMRGTEEPAPKKEADHLEEVTNIERAEDAGLARPAAAAAAPASWRSVLFMPVTFPLTVGGTTFAFFVAARAESSGMKENIALSVAGLVYAAVTGLTLWASGHVERRVSPGTRIFLERIAGILLVAIASILLLSGGPRMVMETIQNMKQ